MNATRTPRAEKAARDRADKAARSARDDRSDNGDKADRADKGARAIEKKPRTARAPAGRKSASMPIAGADGQTGASGPPSRTPPERAEATATFRTVRDWVRYAAARLQHAGVAYGHGTSNAIDEATWLVSWALDLAIDRYPEFADARIAPSERERVIALVERRCRERLPLAYLTGEAWLCGLRFIADQRALVPRSPIAEAIVNGSVSPFIGDHEPDTVLDLCCGSASIAIVAAHHWPRARVVGSDRSADALDLARENLALHGLSDRVRLVESDLFSGLRRQRFDLILCNPPYVNAGSMAVLPPEYRAEPNGALDGGNDGMTLVAKIIGSARRHLDSDGLLVIEIGHEADAFERRFGRLEHAWIPVAGGDRMLVALRADRLPTT